MFEKIGFPRTHVMTMSHVNSYHYNLQHLQEKNYTQNTMVNEQRCKN